MNSASCWSSRLQSYWRDSQTELKEVGLARASFSEQLPKTTVTEEARDKIVFEKQLMSGKVS